MIVIGYALIGLLLGVLFTHLSPAAEVTRREPGGEPPAHAGSVSFAVWGYRTPGRWFCGSPRCLRWMRLPAAS